MEGVYEEGYFVSMKYRPQNVDSYNWKFFHILIIRLFLGIPGSGI
jgi:hypothetical protein